MLNPLSVHKGNKFDWLLWGSITLLAYAVRVFLRLVWHINFQVDDLPTVQKKGGAEQSYSRFGNARNAPKASRLRICLDG